MCRRWREYALDITVQLLYNRSATLRIWLKI